MHCNDEPAPPVASAAFERDGTPPEGEEPGDSQPPGENDQEGEDEAGYGYGV
jgi:hypothetical protein